MKRYSVKTTGSDNSLARFDSKSAAVAYAKKLKKVARTGIRVVDEKARWKMTGDGWKRSNPGRGGTSTASRTATRTATEATTTGNKTSTSTGGASTSGGNVHISVKHNPAARVGGKGVTLRNMASVTVKRLPGGAVAITGRKLGGRSNPKRRCKR